VSLKSLIRPIYRASNLRYRKATLQIAKFIFSLNQTTSRLTLSYSAGIKSDGLGAQLQRVLAINALGEYWRVPVRHLPLKQIAVHPLDGFVNDDEYLDFLKSINLLIDSSDSMEVTGPKFIHVDDLRFRHIFLLAIILFFSSRTYILTVTHPYFFIDSMPSLYSCKSNLTIREKLRLYITETKFQRIILHHRHGVGNMAIQPGQNNSREIALPAYSNILKSIIDQNPQLKFSVYTDAPQIDLLFRPPNEQKKSWQNLPSFDGDSMMILGSSLENLICGLPKDTEVIRGGHPLQTLANMTTGSVLILSRSSFGYVAALLSENAEILVPEDFWHPPLLGWKTYSLEVDND
jgi:hypothetical protein